ncbi:MAG: hypothetical protein ABIK38_00290 [candidate division WOR-3 bacterium]
MKRWWLIGMMIAGLVLLSCDIFGSKVDYYPLTVGNSWSYRGYARMLTVTDDQPDTMQTMTIQVVATGKDNLNSGEEVIELVSTNSVHLYFPFETTYIVVDTSYARETGDFLLTYESKTDSAPDTTLALPLTKDKTWRINEFTVARVLQQEDVSVPAGIYRSAWKVEQTVTSGAQTFTQHWWYGNNVGPVKAHWQESYGTANYEFSLELTSATIK